MAFATGINLETGKTELFDFINVSKSGTYKGLWDASTNTPFLTNGTGEDGDYYEVSVGGTVNFGNGDIIFVVGDTVAYSRGKWQKGDKPLINDEEISYDTTWSSTKILQVIETASTADVYTYKGETAVLPNGTEETPNNKGDVWLLTTDGLPYWWDGDVWRRFGVDAYTKTETENVIEEKLEPVETKLAFALKYRGAVNTTALLPASAENGDTYFVKADGFMYTYNSTTSSWDALGTVADMTNYFTKTEITAMLQDKADKFQYDVLPTPSSETVGLLLQYTGADTEDYKNSYFYKGIDKGNDTYGWELAKIGKYEDIINDSTTSASTTWSSEKISADLVNKQDFRLFKSLEEFNEKKGTSLTVVSGVDNMKDIANAMSNGEILIIVVKYVLSSDVYFGLTTDTGWTKMFTFIKSDGLCDVECRTSVPLTFKRVLNPDGLVGDWQELATTDSTLKTIQLSGSVDCNTLTEPGLYTASAGAVSALTNAPVNNQVQLDGGFSILVTKTNVDSVYYGMQMFIPYGSDVPFIRKPYYLNGQYWTNWQQLVTKSDLSTYYHKCIYARTNKTGSKLVKTLALKDGKCYTIEGYQGNNYRRTRVYFFSGTIRTTDEITSQMSPFTLSYDDTHYNNVLTITFADWSYNQCRIYEESPANAVNIG